MDGNSATSTVRGQGMLWQGLSSGEQTATAVILTALVILALYIWADRTKSAPDGSSGLAGWIGIRDIAPWQARLLGIVFLAFAGLFALALMASYRLVGAALFADISETTPAQSFGIGALLVALLGAPFLIWRSVVAQKTVDITEQGLITDRINAAVASLGEEKTRGTGDAAETLPNMEVRIGAIYALERIARENLDFHVQIMEILCAYIRENSPADSAEPLHMPQTPAEYAKNPRDTWEDWESKLIQALTDLKTRIKPRTDIQTALEVLGRRTEAQRRREAGWPDPNRDGKFVFDTDFPSAPTYPKTYTPEAHKNWSGKLDAFVSEARETRRSYSAFPGYRLDLRATNLQGYDLKRLHMKGARFDHAQMQGANLGSAQMQGAELVSAQMQGAELVSAQMQGANLRDAQMQEADLRSAQMQGAELGSAQMQGAELVSAQMQGAELGGAQMQGAYLESAQMQGADLRSAQMQGAVLWGAQMQGADLRSAQMQGANLWDAQMQGANLWYAQMQGANLWGAQMSEDTDLTAATLRGAAVRSVDAITIARLRPFWSDIFADGSIPVLPEERPAHWPDFELDSGQFFTEWRKWQAAPAAYTPPDRPSDPPAR